MPPVASTTALALKTREAAALAVVAERAGDAVAVLEQRGRPCTPCGPRCPGGCRGPAGCGSSPGRCGRRRGPGAGSGGRRSCAAGCGRPWCGRRPRPRPPARARGPGASWACSSAMRQLLTYWPPRMVSAKWTFQLSRSSTLARAAAMPPSAMTVWALPSSDLQTSPTDDAGRRRLDGGPQAGAAGADDQDVVLVGLDSLRHLEDPPVGDRRPSSTGGRRGR